LSLLGGAVFNVDWALGGTKGGKGDKGEMYALR